MEETEIRDKAFEAALRLAAEQAWDDLRLSDIADAAGMPLSQFHGITDRDKLALHVDPYFDRAMSAEGIDSNDHPRERLFDVIMLRFEAMEQHREGLLSLFRALDRAPVARVKRIRSRRESAEWALISAGLDGASAIPVRIKALGLAWVLARAEEAWRRETDPGFAKTMSALDKGLRQAEARMKRMGAFSPWGRNQTASSGTAQETTDPSAPPAEPPEEATHPAT